VFSEYVIDGLVLKVSRQHQHRHKLMLLPPLLLPSRAQKEKGKGCPAKVKEASCQGC
jgi:hypothetical protein